MGTAQAGGPSSQSSVPLLIPLPQCTGSLFTTCAREDAGTERGRGIKMSHSGYWQVGLILIHVGKNVENQPGCIGRLSMHQRLLEVWGIRAQRAAEARLSSAVKALIFSKSSSSFLGGFNEPCTLALLYFSSQFSISSYGVLCFLSLIHSHSTIY